MAMDAACECVSPQVVVTMSGNTHPTEPVPSKSNVMQVRIVRTNLTNPTTRNEMTEEPQSSSPGPGTGLSLSFLRLPHICLIHVVARSTAGNGKARCETHS